METYWETITSATILKRGDIIRQPQVHDTYRYFTIAETLTDGAYHLYWDGLDLGNLLLVGTTEIFIADRYEKKVIS